jgi:type II secretory pathway pseudopilin PulG
VRARARGFTILELAVALFLLTLLFGGIVMPLQSQVEIRRIEDTAALLEKAREALLGYAAARGYFPCPSDGTSAGEPAATDHATGACTTQYGFLPGAALGLQQLDAQGYALDAWGGPANRIRYAVSGAAVGAGGNTNTFTRVNGMRTAGIAALGDPALSLFHVCAAAAGVSPGTSCGSGNTLVSTAPVVIWSAGGNAASGGASADEAQNPNPNGGSADRIFVSRVRSEVSGSEFDDQVIWIPMPVLVARLVAAGQLP